MKKALERSICRVSYNDKIYTIFDEHAILMSHCRLLKYDLQRPESAVFIQNSESVANGLRTQYSETYSKGYFWLTLSMIKVFPSLTIEYLMINNWGVIIKYLGNT